MKIKTSFRHISIFFLKPINSSIVAEKVQKLKFFLNRRIPIKKMSKIGKNQFRKGIVHEHNTESLKKCFNSDLYIYIIYIFINIIS